MLNLVSMTQQLDTPLRLTFAGNSVRNALGRSESLKFLPVSGEYFDQSISVTASARVQPGLDSVFNGAATPLIHQQRNKTGLEAENITGYSYAYDH